MLSIEFETRSDVDLKACGAYVYASDPSTQVYMMGWAFGDEEPKTWLPGEPFPERITHHLAVGGDIYAWNAQFERLIWDYIMVEDHGALPAYPYQFKCTAARARAKLWCCCMVPASLACGSRSTRCWPSAAILSPPNSLASAKRRCRNGFAVLTT